MSEKSESEYHIYYIDPKNHLNSEDLELDSDVDIEANDGIIPKIWNDDRELKSCLFKVAHRTPRSSRDVRVDWAEKVVSEIADLLGIPTAKYEFATTYFRNSPELVEGIVSINCVATGNVRQSGEELLNQMIDDGSEASQQYTIENSISALDLAQVKRPSGYDRIPNGIESGSETFIGYILLDTLVDNWDRHAENWSIILGEEIELMPCYDYGESLCSGDNDEEKQSIKLDEYIQVSSSSFTNQEGTKRLSMLEVFNRAAQLKPQAAQIWLEKLAAITPEQIEEIFERIPESRITPASAKFAQDLIAYNQTELLQTYQTELDSNSSLITFSDINNYRNYLNSREYKQQLPPTEQKDLGKKANEIIDPLMNQFRTIARAEAGEFLPAPHPYFRSFKTEMDLSEQDRSGIEKARDWARRQPVAPIEEEDRSRGLDR